MLSVKSIKIVLFVVAILIFVGVLIVQNTGNDKKPIVKNQEVEENLEPNPWVEIVSSQAVKKDSQTGVVLVELKTGDEVKQGDILETNENGLANIYFPDGSVIRLENNTSIVIEKSSFDKKSNSLKMQIELKIGRAWSRVMQMTTSNSFWKIKTSNVVATVRGTAFAVEHFEEKSAVLVDKGKIETAAFDQETNKITEYSTIILGENQMIEITKKEIQELKIKQQKLISKEIPKQVLQEEWIQRNKTADTQLLEKIEQLKERGVQSNDMGMAVKKEIIANTKEIIQPDKNTSELAPEPKLEPIPKPAPEPTPIIEKTLIKPEPVELIKKEEIKLEVQPKGIKIIMPTTNKMLVEDDILILKAILLMSDGTRKDITKQCNWSVLGEIGVIESPGFFKAKLVASIAELGKVPGQVICSWTDFKTNEEFLSTTPIINVKAKVEFDPETRG
ncbi:FecR domain-containing protein [Patescibacteria group bacterium]|nr:FecR domain-containing protein [Patescibacteria group bacterium]MBU1730339.1 FecR domain-containing protein [Patescibacteria group bacterium]MBU1956199.1 FecR domain-containing protein [Patescibacteria group bacterium]MBU2010063.1 FecR domain-containing protein [Patescibacteria group bacterium]MBU2416623.1 FecR domain-containing protein [Patescibacteria group bacterium]